MAARLVAPVAAPAPAPVAVSVVAPLDAPPEPTDSALADRWDATFKALCEQGSVVAMVRELGSQAGLLAVDDSSSLQRWKLQVAREPLRNPVLADKLAAALSALLGHVVVLDVEAGNPSDTPALREAAERARRQAAAEASIQQDPVVLELMRQFKTARIVPGSIKPL